jgi:hypothetical protein
MSRLSKLGFSSSLASSSLASSSFASSVSPPFKDRRTPTIPCRSFVPECSPIRSAGVPSFTEVRTGSYLATRSSRASATATAPAPARSAPSTSAASTRSRFLRAPPSEGRGAAQQDPLDASREIMERARLRTQHIRSRLGLPERPRVDLRTQPRVEPASAPSVPTTRPTRVDPRNQSRVDLEAIRSRYGLPERTRVDTRTQPRVELEAIRSHYGLPERTRVDPRTQPRVEPASTPSVPTTRPTRWGERIRVLAEETATLSAKHRATDLKLAAFDEVVARVRARKQSTTSAPSIDATRPITRSERVQPSAPSVNATRSSTRSEQARPSAPSIDAKRQARPSRLPVPAKPSAPSIDALRQAQPSRLPVPTKSIRSTAIPAADLARTRPSTSADRLRRDKPAKKVRFEEDVTVQTVSRWIVKNRDVHQNPPRRR